MRFNDLFALMLDHKGGNDNYKHLKLKMGTQKLSVTSLTSIKTISMGKKIFYTLELRFINFYFSSVFPMNTLLTRVRLCGAERKGNSKKAEN